MFGRQNAELENACLAMLLSSGSQNESLQKALQLLKGRI